VQGLLKGEEEMQSSSRGEETLSSMQLAEDTFPSAEEVQHPSQLQPDSKTKPHASQHDVHTKNKHLLFALPSTPLIHHQPQHLLRTPSPHPFPQSSSPSKRLAPTPSRARPAARGTPLFALPEIVAVDTATYSETTPTTKYAADFLGLPAGSDGLGREHSADMPRSGIIQMTAVWTENRHRRKAGKPHEPPALKWEWARSRTKRVA
jgi:hypothetical protein